MRPIPHASQSIAEEDMPHAMMAISQKLGRPEYFGDETETILCESYPCRELGKVEAHGRYGDSFDITDFGQPITNRYGTKVWHFLEIVF